jgi:hypothetical protein
VVADHALTLHFRRVGGQHRNDPCVRKKVGHRLRRDAAGVELVERVRQAAFARRRTGQVVRPAAANVVRILGDVRQLQKIAESAHDRLGGRARQRIEQRRQLGTHRRITVAGETHGGLAHVFDDAENGIAFLFAHSVTEQTAEQADVVAQGFGLGAVVRMFGHGLSWRKIGEMGHRNP